MQIPLDEVLHFDAITSDPTTGAAADADSTPTFAVYEEATDTDIGVGGNLTKRTSLTGNYRGTFTLSTANGFEVGKWYSVIVSATVGTVAGKGVVKNFRVVAAESIAGTPKSDVSALGGDAQSAADLKDFADAGYDPATNKVEGVKLADTLTTYTGNTPQTGDVYAIANSGTHGNAALKSLIDTVDGVVDTILVDTNELQVDWVNGGRLDLLLDTIVENTDSLVSSVGIIAGLLDTEIGAILADTNELQTDWVNGGRLDLLVDAIKAKTDGLPASPAAVGSAMTLTAAYDFAKGTVAMTESYAANGAAPTPAQAFFAIHQMLMQFGIASTSLTVKKLDNSTTAFVVTLDDATTPTAAART